MKKTTTYKVISVLLSIIFFIYLYVHVTYVFRDPLSHTQAHLTGFYAEEDNTLDVIILGTSATFSAYMPMELWGEYGITAYDFCTNVMFEESMPYAIREFEKTQNPKLVVIDLATFMYGHNSTNSKDVEEHYRFNVDGYKISKNRIDLINSIIIDDRDKLPYYFDLMYYHESYHPNLKNWNYEVHGFQKGYSNLQIEVNYPGENNRCTREYEDKLNLPDNYEYPKLDEENINNLLNELKKYDFETLFVIDPYFVSDEKSLQYHYRAQYLKKLITDRGYNVLDMYEHYDEIGINPETDYSLDALHYHIESAQKVTCFLGEYLNNNYTMTDHREDEKYSQWIEDYLNWKEYVTEQEMWTIKDRSQIKME